MNTYIIKLHFEVNLSWMIYYPCHDADDNTVYELTAEAPCRAYGQAMGRPMWVNNLYSKVPNKHTGVIIYFRIAVHPVRSLFRTVCLFFSPKVQIRSKKIILGGAFIWKFIMFRVYNNTYKLYIWQMGYLLCELIVYYAPCLHSAFIWFWEFVRGCSYSAQCFYLILRIFPGGALIPPSAFIWNFRVDASAPSHQWL